MLYFNSTNGFIHLIFFVENFGIEKTFITLLYETDCVTANHEPPRKYEENLDLRFGQAAQCLRFDRIAGAA